MSVVQPQDVGGLLASVPFDQMLENVGKAIARAQAELDRESITILQEMCEKDTVRLPALKIEKGKLKDETLTTSMIGAGFQPTFYQFAETIIEVKMTINVATESTEEKEISGEETTTTTNYYRNPFSRRLRRARTVVTTTPVDATYTNKYNFTQEGTSMMRTRLVPVPPNSIIQRQLEMRAQAMQLDYELQLKEYELYIEMLREEREKNAEEKLKTTQDEISKEIGKEEKEKK